MYNTNELSMTKFLKTTVLLFLLFLFTLACSRFSSDSSTGDEGDTNPKPNPSNLIYFLMQNHNSIFILNPELGKFDTLQFIPDTLIDFSISGSRFLFALTRDSLFQYDLLNERLLKRFALTYEPKGQLSSNADGSLVVYETQKNNKKNVCFFYPSTKSTFLLGQALASPHFPLLSPSGRWLAFARNDGFYIKSVTSQSETRLYSTPLRPIQFSPGDSYLSAGGLIFDLLNVQIEPNNGRRGIIKFIDNENIIWAIPNSTILKMGKLSGTSETFLFSTDTPIIDFEISREKQFVAGVNVQAGGLNFTIYDFSNHEMEAAFVFPFSPEDQLLRLVWPEKPSRLTHDN